jgi:Stress responsive A/B Barrel Domain
MIRHVVFFKFKPEITDADREWVFNLIRDAVAKIPQAKHFSIGKQLVPSQDWYKERLATDFIWGLSADFDSEDDLYTYQKHPLHMESLLELGKRISERKVYDLVS